MKLKKQVEIWVINKQAKQDYQDVVIENLAKGKPQQETHLTAEELIKKLKQEDKD